MDSTDHMDSTNPYTTPASTTSLEPGSLAALGELVRAWEKRRLLYNGILLLPGIGTLALLMTENGATIGAVIAFGVLCGLGANVAFLAGPLAELYLRVLFFRSQPSPNLRRVLFFGGILVSLGIIAFVCLVALLSSTQSRAISWQPTASQSH